MSMRAFILPLLGGLLVLSSSLARSEDGSPLGPFPAAVVERVVELAELEPGDQLYDLGYGDARVALTASAKTGAKSRGFYPNPILIARSQARAESQGLANLVSIQQNAMLYQIELEGANAVTLYLPTNVLQVLVDRIRKLESGVRIVTHRWPLPGVKLQEHAKVVSGSTEHHVYAWVTPLQLGSPEPGAIPEEHREPDVPFVGTPPEIVMQMLELGRVQEGDLVYDLGSGDGRIVIAAAKQFGARGHGVELDGKLVELSKQRAQQVGVEGQVSFEQADMFTIDLAEVDVVTLFVGMDLTVRLIPQLRQMKQGARIVSHDAPLPPVFPPEKQVELRYEGKLHTLYLYAAPLP